MCTSMKNWPSFSWNQAAILDVLIPLRYQQGILIGGMESMGFQLRENSILQTLTQDVVKSSEIEGEIVDPLSGRSSIYCLSFERLAEATRLNAKQLLKLNLN